MSLFPIDRGYRRFNGPFDNFFGTQLDLFDPWSDFDHFPQSSAFRWINQPVHLNRRPSQPILPPVQQEKCRFQLNVAGFNPDSIKTKVEDNKIVVAAKQEDRDGDDYHVRELKKSYALPEYADVNNVVSFVTPNNMLVIEVPVRNPEVEKRIVLERQNSAENESQLNQWGVNRDPLFDYPGFVASAFAPQIVQGQNGTKQLKMSVKMDEYRPDQIKVSVKDQQLFISGEREHKDANRQEKSYFYRSCTLPPGTKIDELQSHLNGGQLEIEAPFVEPPQPAIQYH